MKWVRGPGRPGVVLVAVVAFVCGAILGPPIAATARGIVRSVRVTRVPPTATADVRTIEIEDPSGAVYPVGTVLPEVASFVVFWSLGCTYCRELVSDIRLLEERFPDHEFILVGLDAQVELTQTFVREAGAQARTYSLAAHDLGDTRDRYQLDSIPAILEFGADGALVERWSGYGGLEHFSGMASCGDTFTTPATVGSCGG